MALTPRVLVFSPALGGHRQNYCRALADILHDAGCAVVVAGSLGGLDPLERAAFEGALRRRGPVEVVDTSAYREAAATSTWRRSAGWWVSRRPRSPC